MMTADSASTAKPIERLLVVAYLVAATWLAADYWIIWEKPILSPAFTVAHSLLGDIRELPLGERWTNRYTQRIKAQADAGIINKNALVMLPFPAHRDGQVIQVEMKSLFVNPGYSPEVTLLYNDKPVLQQELDYSWRRYEFSAPPGSSFWPAHLKIRLDMVPMKGSQPYGMRKVLRFEPGSQGFEQWTAGKWEESDAEDLPTAADIQWTGHELTIDGRTVRLDHWPVIVGLDPWNSPTMRGKLLLSRLPVAAIRSVRIKPLENELE